MISTESVIILDDKPIEEDMNSFRLLSQLNIEQQTLVVHESKLEGLWNVDQNLERVEFKIKFNKFNYVFIHDSFNDVAMNERIKPLIVEEILRTSTIVFFSGSTENSEHPLKIRFDKRLFPDLFVFEIGRRAYYNGFANFLDSKLILGKYDLKYLYNPKLKPIKTKAIFLLEEIRKIMEESFSAALESTELVDLLLLKYDKRQIEMAISRFRVMDEQEFIDTMDYHIQNL